MAETNHCPTCDCELPPGAPSGLCPACLLKAGMTSDHVEPGTKSNAHAFSAPSPAELAPHFPQLEILELIGQGGMGAVYKAKQIRLDRIVALKALPKDADRSQEFADRFNREAKAMARLSHPNIIAIHDYGEAGGWFYFVMEFVDGVNMRQAMKSEPIKPSDALAVVTQICDALQYAHEENVVHRDIKPENILLTRKGKVKIADFGLAKLLGMSHMDRHLTATQQVMGTIGYMAPEQMEGSKAVDHRADIYALGVVFYELLTGELPMGRFAPPSQKVQVDIRIDEVVLKSLEREPSRRYQSASQIKHEVEQISAGSTGVVTNLPVTARSHLSTRLTWLGMVFLALGIVELAAGFASIFSLMDVMQRRERVRDASSPLVQLGYGLVWVDFIGLSVLVVAAGLLILFRRLRAVAILGSFAAMLPFATVGAMIVPNRAELMRDFNFNQWLGVAGIPLGVWGLVELIRPGTTALFRWPIAPLLVAAWRFLYPRVLNSTLITVVPCAISLAVMIWAPWSLSTDSNKNEPHFYSWAATSTAAVYYTAGMIIFLVATWTYTWRPVQWRPFLTIIFAIPILLYSWVYIQGSGPLQVGCIASFFAGGILLLNGLWRYSRWSARERPQPKPLTTPTKFDVPSSEVNAPKRNWAIGWIAALLVLVAVATGGLLYLQEGWRGWDNELVQTGFLTPRRGQEGQVDFFDFYERPPNIEFDGDGDSFVHVIERTSQGFRWTYDPNASVEGTQIKWRARGRRRSGAPIPSEKAANADIEKQKTESLTQTGNFIITPGQEGWVYFAERFDRPPNVELDNVGFSKTHIAQCTAEGFQWKNADKTEDVLWSNLRITWTAKLKKQ